jgi:hypothetical protein
MKLKTWLLLIAEINIWENLQGRENQIEKLLLHQLKSLLNKTRSDSQKRRFLHLKEDMNLNLKVINQIMSLTLILNSQVIHQVSQNNLTLHSSSTLTGIKLTSINNTDNVKKKMNSMTSVLRIMGEKTLTLIY